MTATNLAALVDQVYRESPAPFQWAREAAVNSDEAGATKVYFGVEWQGVETKGVYRRLILDNGSGMDPDKMELFLKTYGGSGKPVGGALEHYGHGLKTSTLPWNKRGIVVVSRFAGYSDAMARLGHFPDKNEYGIQHEAGLPVYEAIDCTDTDGIDYRRVIPDDYESGTAIILFGSDEQPDSFLGAYDRNEAIDGGLIKYLNTRFWEPKLEITVERFRAHGVRTSWPVSEADRKGKAYDRTIRGARHFITEPPLKRSSRLVGSNILPTRDGLAKIHWFLREGDLPGTDVEAQANGCIWYLYKGELFYLNTNTNSFKVFGIPPWLNKQAFIVIEPVVWDDKTKIGVYDDNARASLIMGYRGDRIEIPNIDWARDFNENLPPEIANVIRAHNAANARGFLDDDWAKKLADRFGRLWKIPALVLRQNGASRIKPVAHVNVRVPGSGPAPSPPRPRPNPVPGPVPAPNGKPVVAHPSEPGDEPAGPGIVAGGVPDWAPVRRDDEFPEQPWALASWEEPNDTNGWRGRVLINIDHPIITKHVAETVEAWPRYEDEIPGKVYETYGRLGAAHVAHSRELRKLMPNASFENLYTTESMTMALLGWLQIDAILRPALGGQWGKAKT
jgi:hypothetical protein